MDGVMMMLLVAALWLCVRALRPGAERALLLAGVAAGLAFEVKLMEALLALPALAVLFWLGSEAPPRRRARILAVSGAIGVVVGLGWAVLVSLSPGRHPWPVGSSDGSVWNAMFVFNGFGRAGAAQPGKTGGPGLFRLVEASGWHYDILFGCALVGALALGAAAVSVAGRRSGPPGPRALAAACGVWLVIGLVVFDVARTVHARYFDAVAPAVALTVGCGAAALAGLYGHGIAPRLGPRRLAAGGLALLTIGIYTFRFRPGNVALSVVMLWFAAAGAVLLVRAGGSRSSGARWLLAGLLTAVAVLFPAHESLRLIRDHADDSAGLGQLDAGSIRALAAVPGLPAAELAVDDPLPLAPLILRDGQPLLPLSSFAGRPLGSVAELATAVHTGRVRFGLVARPRCTSAPHSPPCLPAARWIRAHGTALAVPGLVRTERLYRLAA
jgi:4-amino-4-deoxy-L-arabinose transferase-like glycosyltransferase